MLKDKKTTMTDSTKKIFYTTLMLISLACQAQKNTLYIDGKGLYSAEGEKIVLRGMNVMSVWSQDKTGSWVMKEVAKTGANCARLVWTQEYGNKKQLATLIDNCIANKMIAIPEPHDATGNWDMIDTCINFWKDTVLINAVERNKKWTIVNVGNEIGDHNVTAIQFATNYKRAIDSLRNWGYTVPIMIDASTWGQNVDVLFDTWKEILAHDPMKNVLFSAHSYWSSTANYNRIAEKSEQENMPIIIGEGPSIALPANCSILDYETGLDILGENNIGWLSWSWGAVNNSDCGSSFDHTKNGKFGNWETDYAVELVAGHQYGLMNTAERPLSMFSDRIIPASGIQVLPYNPTMELGDSLPMAVAIAPANANDKTYKLSIVQDSSVLRFSNDTSYIVAVGYGKAKLKAEHIANSLVSESSIIISNPFVSGPETRTSNTSATNTETEIYPIPINSNLLHINFDFEHTGSFRITNLEGILLYKNDFNTTSFITIDTRSINFEGNAILSITLTDGTIIERLLSF